MEYPLPGLYMEYEYMSYGSAGAYDVWRFLWYTVVVIKDSTIRQGSSGAAGAAVGVIDPERYYLHCTNEDGQSVFQNQIRITQVLLYGLEYDITGSRLISLAVPIQIGRTPVITANTDDKWEYKITAIEIDESIMSFPRLTQVQHELNDENLQSMSALYKQSPAAQNNLVFTGASTIIGRTSFKSYAVTQVEKSDKRADHFFLFNLIEEQNAGTGKTPLARVKLIHRQELGFKVGYSSSKRPPQQKFFLYQHRRRMME